MAQCLEVGSERVEHEEEAVLLGDALLRSVDSLLALAASGHQVSQAEQVVGDEDEGVFRQISAILILEKMEHIVRTLILL